MADLGRWLGGDYRIGGEPAVPEAEEPDARRESPADLRFGGGVAPGRGRGDASDESRVVLQCGELLHQGSIRGRPGDRNRDGYSLHDAHV